MKEDSRTFKFFIMRACVRMCLADEWVGGTKVLLISGGKFKNV